MIQTPKRKREDDKKSDSEHDSELDESDPDSDSDTNEIMHERNPYKRRKPDFMILANKYPLFREKISVSSIGKLFLNWKDPETLRCLTKVLLLEDFGIELHLPQNRLCPPVPNRLNYICWLSELVDILQLNKSNIQILDIGVGASCIYPILGYKSYNWNFIGCDIDPISLEWAYKNIQSNDLSSFIKLIQIPDSLQLQHIIYSEFNKLGLYSRQSKEIQIHRKKQQNIPITYELTKVNSTSNEDSNSYNILNTSQQIQRLLLYSLLHPLHPLTVSPTQINTLIRGPIRQTFCRMDNILQSHVMECENRFISYIHSLFQSLNIFESRLESLLDALMSKNMPFHGIITDLHGDFNLHSAPILMACMTNPPFYHTDEHIQPSQHTVCTAAPTEASTEGGEECFVAAMVLDSIILGP
eukprot:gene1518-2918_t